jgi:hypothetical protein
LLKSRETIWAGIGLCLLSAMIACGTPGAPQPPSLNLPKPVQDLVASRKGHKVLLSWTVPRQNTDTTNIRRIGSTRVCRDLRITSTRCSEIGRIATEHLLPTTSRHDIPSPPPVRASYADTLPPQLIAGKPLGDVSYAVETLNRNGRSAGLSNQARVSLAPSLDAPRNLSAQLLAQGVQLSWEGAAAPAQPGISYRFRVYRQDESPPQQKKAGANPQVVIGELPVAGRASFMDQTFEWEKPYLYHVSTVTAAQHAHGIVEEVEGDDSNLVRLYARDTFPPAVPSGLQAVFSGVGQQPFVDLTWAPDLDADLAGYNVYRRTGGGPPIRLSTELVPAPSFRDTNVAARGKYYYSVSAVDLRGNESARSQETTEAIP